MNSLFEMCRMGSLPGWVRTGINVLSKGGSWMQGGSDRGCRVFVFVCLFSLLLGCCVREGNSRVRGDLEGWQWMVATIQVVAYGTK